MMTAARKPTKRPVEILSYSEAEALIGACSKTAPTGIRDAALLALMWRSGARIGEAVALRPKDIDLSAGSVRILRGKGGKARTVALEAAAHPFILRWLDKRKELRINGRNHLFCTLKGNAMSTTAARYMVKRRAARAGIAKRCHPHGLRHSFAAELAARGVPVHAIQMQLGHANLQVTSVYVSHLQPQELLDRLRDLGPMPSA